jgi:hypothetical protein
MTAVSFSAKEIDVPNNRIILFKSCFFYFINDYSDFINADNECVALIARPLFPSLKCFDSLGKPLPAQAPVHGKQP